MKTIFLLVTILAISVAEEPSKNEVDSKVEAPIDILKSNIDETLSSEASSYDYQAKYVPPSQRPPRPWEQQGSAPQNNYSPPQNNYVPPQNSYVPPQNNYSPPQNNYVQPQNNYVQPQSDYAIPQNDYTQGNYVPPQNNYIPPQNNYQPPQNNYQPPQNNYQPPQNNYQPPQNNYQPTAPTPAPIYVVKNEQTSGDNGSYRYEYQLSDGTSVSEEGYIKNPNTEYAIPVKRGWYSYPGADGKIYTVTYWADESGYHASGEHLPTPPPIPPEIQASIDQAAKEEAEKNKTPQPGSYPQQPTTQGYYPQPLPQQPVTSGYYPAPTPQQPVTPAYYPAPQQPTNSGYYPQQQPTYYPQPSNPSYGKK